MENVDLFNRQKNFIIPFDIHEVIAGISTRDLGSFLLSEKDVENRMDFIKSYCQTDHIGMLAPNHGIDIIRVNEVQGNNFFYGDAIYTGENQTDFLCLIHCSWKTLHRQIISRTFSKIAENIAISKDQLHALLYPGICQCCYEVMSDVRSKFNTVENLPFFKQTYSNRWLFDLSGYIRHELISYGLSHDKIRTISTCSAHSLGDTKLSNNSEYLLYSYRARKEKERNLVFARLTKSHFVLSGFTGDCPYIILY